MISSKAAKRGHSTGVAVGRRTNSIIMSGAARVGRASARLARMPSQMTRFSQRPAVVSLIIGVLRTVSEGLQVLHDGILVGGGKRDAVFVPHVSVARDVRVVAGEPASAGFGDVRHEADALLIEHVVAAIERRR